MLKLLGYTKHYILTIDGNNYMINDIYNDGVEILNEDGSRVGCAIYRYLLEIYKAMC
jgi:hypothetical protein